MCKAAKKTGRKRRVSLKSFGIPPKLRRYAVKINRSQLEVCDMVSYVTAQMSIGDAWHHANGTAELIGFNPATAVIVVEELEEDEK